MNFKERFIQQRKDFAELMKHYPFTTEALAGEEWRDIEGYDGKYQISNYGRVKSFKCKTPHILKPFLSRDGYLKNNLCLQGKQCPRAVHRLVAQVFIPNPDNKPQINHVDGVKWNACSTNLEWATNSENQCHAYNTGLQVARRGSDVNFAKLTNEQVIYIRENPDNLSVRQLGEKLGLDRRTISNVQRGKSYRNTGGKIRNERPKFFRKLSPTVCNYIYYLYQTGKYSQRQLGKMFGVAQTAIGYVIRNIDKGLNRETYYRFKLPILVREQIRTEYCKGVKGCGSYALAKKYGCDAVTILKIVHAGDAEYKPDEKKPPVPDNIREQIRAEYQKGVRGRGSVVLAKKYGVSRGTIIKIVNEK